VVEKVHVGLTASQIKWIALLFMTIDHLYVLCESIPIISHYVLFLRLFGRAAAPLFLFLITESAWHTRSKFGFLTRLYSAGVGTGIFTILTNQLLGHIMIYTPGNIFFTFFYTVVYIYIFEYIISAIQKHDVKLVLKYFFIGIFTLLPQALFYLFDKWKFQDLERDTVIFLREIITTVFPPIVYVEYSVLFVIMGVGIYFCKNLKHKCFIFIFFCGLSFIGSLSDKDLYPINEFVLNGQYWMILALPFIYFYNGDKGKQKKLFFYIYYPVHRYLLTLAGELLRGI